VSDAITNKPLPFWESHMTEIRYQIETQQVGSGGFGKVRKGRDTILERDVAVKTLDPVWVTADDRDRERFKREARTLAMLSHPNIPAIYDVVFGQSQFHIVFQFIEGTNLRKLLADGPIALPEAQLWFDQLASALQHAHAKLLIHRDIKPENMIVTADKRHCYLVDFGIALSDKDFERLTPSDHVIGTPGYMSPEHENGEVLDASDDVYVLGVCLYEALCGHRVAAGDYEPLNRRNEAVPPALDELIQGCIAPKPQRIRTASEFRKKLKAALVSHRPLSTVLFQGQLYDVIMAIRGMQPHDFSQLRAGQRLLILSKCRDLVLDTNPRLNSARSEFLAVLSTLAVQVEPENYKAIIQPALRCGFDKQFDDWTGDRRIRQALKEAAIALDKENHHVMVETVLEWLNQSNLEEKQNWFYHDLRLLLTRLMANPACADEDALMLNKVLAQINDLQRSKSSDAEVEFGDEELTSRPC
jgi:serine/threonine protein kinase